MDREAKSQFKGLAQRRGGAEKKGKEGVD